MIAAYMKFHRELIDEPREPVRECLSSQSAPWAGNTAESLGMYFVAIGDVG